MSASPAKTSEVTMSFRYDFYLCGACKVFHYDDDALYGEHRALIRGREGVLEYAESYERETWISPSHCERRNNLMASEAY